MEQFKRTELLLGADGLNKLQNARVAIFGIGGVGGYTAEALARSGIGTLDIIDNDTIAISNINRQIIALHSTIGMYKVDAMRDRIRDINPQTVVNAHKCFFLPENANTFNFESYDYIIDAVDTVTAKLSIIECAKAANVPVISSMGAGNKLHPELFELTDISKTSVCPLAKVMRSELKKRNITDVKVVYSKEPAIKPSECIDNEGKRQTPGSIAFVPSVAGLIIASEVVRFIAGSNKAF